MEQVAAENFTPIILLEIELARSLQEISLLHAASRKQYVRAQGLVRIHSRPIGNIRVEAPSGHLEAGTLARLIWDQLHSEINRYLEDNRLPPMEGLDVSALSNVEAPGYLRKRQQILEEAPFLSVVVTTHDRPTALAETLLSISAVNYPSFEVIVVDNAPSTDDTARLVERMSAQLKNLRYIRDQRMGLCWARNRGLEAARGTMTVFTDDDVLVDPDWLAALVQGFGDGENVACVTGLILPRELDTPAQVWCEEHGGFGKGFEARIFDLGAHRPDDPLFPYRLSMFGSGANMCFKTGVLRQLGGCDPALGAGTPTRSAAEFPAFYKVIMNNHQIVYRPDAIVYHSHHERYDLFRRQFFGYGVGFTAFLTKIIVENPTTIFGLLKRFVHGLAFIFSPSSPRHAKKEAGYPGELNRLELLGMLYGPIAYFQSLYRVRRNNGSRHGSPLAKGKAI